MSKKIKIDFYRIAAPDESQAPFESLLQYVNQLNDDDETRTVDIRDAPVRMHQASKEGEFWEGNFIRIRMTGVPVKASRKGSVSSFLLEDHEGMGEQTAFLYHPKTQVLILQTNQSGVSAASFAKYFEVICRLGQPIFIDLVLQPDAVQRLATMRSVRKFQVRTTGLDTMQLFQGADYGVNEMAQLSEAFRAPAMEITLSVERDKEKSLLSESVKNVANWLSRMSIHHQEQVKKIRISGSTEEDELVVIDLLQDRMREQVEIQIGKGRDLSYKKRQEAIRKAWERRKNELLQIAKMFITR
jgi:hypothetical protein